MRSMLKYITAEEMIDCAEAQFFDDVAEGLHDRAIYAIFLLQGIGKSAEGGARKLLERRDSEKKALENCWV